MKKSGFLLGLGLLALGLFTSCPPPVIVVEDFPAQVTWDPQGGTWDVDGAVSSQVKKTSILKGSLLTPPTPPSKTGFSFFAWTRDSEGKQPWTFAQDRVANNFTLFAQWTPVEMCQVAFQSAGGSAVPSIPAAVGQSLNPPAPPTRQNYSFAGWYKDSGYQEIWNFSEDRVQGDLTLYADWDYIEGSPEEFLNADQPIFQKSSGDISGFMKPWNYDKAFNSHRDYPLVVGLHGINAPGGYMPFICWNAEDKKKYPGFLLAPHTSTTDWGTTECTKIVDEIKSLMAQYRIDKNRIYIVGFSMGGGGSYTLAETLFAQTGIVPAGILRISGQYKPSPSLGLMNKTAVWYHSGLSDQAPRVAMGQSALKAYQDAFPEAERSTVQGTWINAALTDPQPKVTQQVTQGWTRFQLTEWTSMGHTSDPVAKDPVTLAWLFAQTLKGR